MFLSFEGCIWLVTTIFFLFENIRGGSCLKILGRWGGGVNVISGDQIIFKIPKFGGCMRVLITLNRLQYYFQIIVLIFNKKKSSWIASNFVLNITIFYIFTWRLSCVKHYDVFHMRLMLYYTLRCFIFSHNANIVLNITMFYIFP